MSAVTGTYRKGKVLLDSPVDWQEGTRVEVNAPVHKVGMTEAEWPTTPEGIAELLARIDAFEPLEMTPEEQAEWHAALEESDRVSKEAVRKQMGLK